MGRVQRKAWNWAGWLPSPSSKVRPNPWPPGSQWEPTIFPPLPCNGGDGPCKWYWGLRSPNTILRSQKTQWMDQVGFRCLYKEHLQAYWVLCWEPSSTPVPTEESILKPEQKEGASRGAPNTAVWSENHVQFICIFLMQGQGDARNVTLPYLYDCLPTRGCSAHTPLACALHRQWNVGLDLALTDIHG